MSSPCRKRSFHIAAIVTLVLIFSSPALAQQTFGNLPASQSGPSFVPVTKIFPGGGSPPPPDPRAAIYQGNAYYINEGHRLFLWYNCVGCHANGGGGMGPALMDNQWRYGGQLDQIYASIAQGRPNGMPSWANKIPDGQIWELAAFVKSLSVPSSENGATPAQAQPQPPPALPAHNPEQPVSEAPSTQSAPK
ncbi:MAG: c-type cytochrome [Deltaproteobacteria bacterium]|nr:c-type cytochrome [Deltaproteobacteria bacterium]